MSSLLSPRYMPSFLSRIGLGIPTFELFIPVDFHFHRFFLLVKLTLSRFFSLVVFFTSRRLNYCLGKHLIIRTEILTLAGFLVLGEGA